MQFKEDKINKLLAEWDILGVGSVGNEWPLYEYKSYVIPMINFHIENGDSYDYLVGMFISMLGKPTTEKLMEIRQYADKFNKIITEKENV